LKISLEACIESYQFVPMILTVLLMKSQ